MSVEIQLCQQSSLCLWTSRQRASKSNLGGYKYSAYMPRWVSPRWVSPCQYSLCHRQIVGSKDSALFSHVVAQGPSSWCSTYGPHTGTAAELLPSFKFTGCVPRGFHDTLAQCVGPSQKKYTITGLAVSLTTIPSNSFCLIKISKRRRIQLFRQVLFSIKPCCPSIISLMKEKEPAVWKDWKWSNQIQERKQTNKQVAGAQLPQTTA